MDLGVMYAGFASVFGFGIRGGLYCMVFSLGPRTIAGKYTPNSSSSE